MFKYGISLKNAYAFKHMTAVDAYKRASSAMKNIKSVNDLPDVDKHTTQGVSVLRQGDNLHSNNNNFADVVTDIVNKQADTIQKGEEYTNRAIEGNANLVEVMSAANDSEIALQTMVNIRDKIVNAYQEILRTPL